MMPTAINRRTGERLVLTDDGWVPLDTPVDRSAFSDTAMHGGRNADRSLKAQLEWLNIERAWNIADRLGVGSIYRTDGRRRSDNVIDARWDVPGETPEQRSARLWAAHDRGVGLARTMIPTIVSRNPKTEGIKAEPLQLQGGDSLVPTAADLERIMAGARNIDVSAFDPPSKVR